MLREQQVAELLRRCEAIAGRELKRLRGNLGKAKTRAAAVWELLVLESASQLAPDQYEDNEGGPDIRLKLPTGRWISIEVAWLRPRFESIERRSELVARWMHEAASKLGAEPPEIECRFDGDEGPAGPQRRLPEEHDRKAFLSDPEVVEFLKAVSKRPLEKHTAKLSSYTVALTATPYQPRQRPFETLSWGGLRPEAPRVAKQHAVYRLIRAMIRQHKVEEPHLVLIGSDSSPAVSSVDWPGTVRLDDAIAAALRETKELCGVVIARIGKNPSTLSVARMARLIPRDKVGIRLPTQSGRSFGRST